MTQFDAEECVRRYLRRRGWCILLPCRGLTGPGCDRALEQLKQAAAPRPMRVIRAGRSRALMVEGLSVSEIRRLGRQLGQSVVLRPTAHGPLLLPGDGGGATRVRSVVGRQVGGPLTFETEVDGHVVQFGFEEVLRG